MAGLAFVLGPPALFFGTRWLGLAVERWHTPRHRRWVKHGQWGRQWEFALLFGGLVGASALFFASQTRGGLGWIDFAGAGADKEVRAIHWRLSILPIVVVGGVILFFGILGGLFGPSGKADETLLFATFFLVLPVLNGFADFLSWYASRRLGAHLLSCLGKVSRWRLFAWTIPSHIAVDVFIAAGLLACLALALPFVMQTISMARDFDYDAAGEIARAAQDPGGQGIWLTIMLFTTLIPTFLHLCMVAASPLSVCFLGEEKRQDWAAKLDRFHD